MKKFTKESIRKLIQQEVKSLLADDAIFTQKSSPGMIQHYNTDKKSSYTAKITLAKITQHAQELYNMIGENEQLDDWKKSRIAQIADDIEEVYDSVKFDSHD